MGYMTKKIHEKGLEMEKRDLELIELSKDREPELNKLWQDHLEYEEQLEVSFFDRALKEHANLIEVNKQVIIHGYFRCDIDDEENHLMWDTANLRADSIELYSPGKRTRTNKPSESEEQKAVNRSAKPRVEAVTTGHIVEAPEDNKPAPNLDSGVISINVEQQEFTVEFPADLFIKKITEIQNIVKNFPGNIKIVLKITEKNDVRLIALSEQQTVSSSGILQLQQLATNN